VLAEGHDVGDAAGLRGGGEPLEIGRIPADHGMAAGHDAGEDLRLGIGNAVEGVEISEVARGDGGDDRNMGLAPCRRAA
jgi:hypothetical protein